MSGQAAGFAGPAARNRHETGYYRLAAQIAPESEKNMKKVIVAAVSLLLFAGYVALAEPSAADQKWLEAVQKMVDKGQTQISTPSADRVKLVKDWAAKSGFTVAVTQNESSYKLEITKHVAKN